MFHHIMKFSIRRWPILLLAGLVVLFLWDILFCGETFFLRDTFCDNQLLREFSAQAIREGHIPLWNSYSCLGQAHAAQPQSSIFYPPHLLFVILPQFMALKTIWLSHLLIAAISMYALARRWAFDRWPAVLSAVLFAFGTCLVAQLEYMNLLEVLSWIPAVILVADKNSFRLATYGTLKNVFSRQGFCSVFLTSCLLACLYLAGYPQYFLYVLCLIAIHGLVTICITRNRHLPIRLFVFYAATGILTAGLVAPSLLSTLELVPFSIRQSGTDPGLNMASMHPLQWLEIIFPFLNGKLGYPDVYWGGSLFEFWVGTLYFGVVPLFLLAYAFVGAKETDIRRRTAFWFAVAAVVVSLVMSMGKFCPGLETLYRDCPGFGYFRWPSKFLVLAAFAAPFLFAYGFQAAMRESELPPTATPLRWKRFAIYAVFAAAVAGFGVAASISPLFAGHFTRSVTPLTEHQLQSVADDMRNAAIWAVLSLGIMGLLLTRMRTAFKSVLVVAAATVNILAVAWQIHPRVSDAVYRQTPNNYAFFQKETADGSRVHSTYATVQQWIYGCSNEKTMAWAKEAMAGETPFPIHIFRSTGGGELRLLEFAMALDLLNGQCPPEAQNKLADLFSIRYVIAGNPMDAILWGGADASLQVIRRDSAMPRAWLAHNLREAHDMRSAFRTILDSNFNIRQDAVVDTNASGMAALQSSIAGLPPAAPATTDGVSNIRFDWNRISLDVSASNPAWLVLNEAWYPGWKVRMEGRAFPSVKTNGIFQGMLVPPGQHHVEFVFDPASFRVGVWISACTIALMLLAGGWCFWKRPKNGSLPTISANR